MCLNTRSRHDARDDLECADRVAARARRCDSSATAAAGSRTATQAVASACGRGIQLQHGGGDDAQRAFRADEQVLQVVAGVVLAQAAQAVPHAPVRQHDFQPEHQVARIAVAQHIDAARIGGKIAADLAELLRGGQAQREKAVVRSRPHRARRRACSRPRRSSCNWRRRWREPGSCATGSARSGRLAGAVRWPRTDWYCRPAARWRSGAQRTAALFPRLVAQSEGNTTASALPE